MSAPAFPFVFDPERLTKHFHPLQPASTAVQSSKSALPACCLGTTLRLLRAGTSSGSPFMLTVSGANTAEGAQSLQIMAASPPGPVLQVLAEPVFGSKTPPSLLLSASGPAQCPPGQPNRVQILAPGGRTRLQTVPVDSCLVALHAPPDFVSPWRATAFPKGCYHPFHLAELTPANWRIAVPACATAKAEAVAAVFPDVRWQGGLEVRAEADAASPTGMRLRVQSDAICSYGGDERRVETWGEALDWCPWLGCVEALAKTVVALEALRPDARWRGVGHPRLSRAEGITWKTWPRCRVQLVAALYERPECGLLGFRSDFQLQADPLLAGGGEWNLLPQWLAEPAWRKRLAPLLADAAGNDPMDLAAEIGLFLVVQGELRLRIDRQEDQPSSRARVSSRTSGEIRLRIEGRSLRAYEGILVRSGHAGAPAEPAKISLACEAPPSETVSTPQPHVCQGRVAFGGLSLWSVEKRRPGIRLRRLRKPHPALAGTHPEPPLDGLLISRVWPAAATTDTADVPWSNP